MLLPLPARLLPGEDRRSDGENSQPIALLLERAKLQPNSVVCL